MQVSKKLIITSIALSVIILFTINQLTEKKQSKITSGVSQIFGKGNIVSSKDGKYNEYFGINKFNFN